MSAVDGNMNRRSKLRRKTDSNDCEHHSEFPNLCDTLVRYLLSKSRDDDLLEEDFRKIFYPSTKTQLPVKFEDYARNLASEEECIRKHLEQWDSRSCAE